MIFRFLFLRNWSMAIMDYASVAQTCLLWKSLIFHAARPVYTYTVFLILKPLKGTINVFTAGKFSILKILLIVLLNSRHYQDMQTLPKPLPYRVKGTPRGKHIRRGERFKNNCTSRIKGTTRGTHVPEGNICQYESTKHAW